MKCSECRGEMIEKREAVTDHRIGLSNLVLVDFPVLRCKRCHAREIVFPRLSQLLETLAASIINQKQRLNGEEVRFLRKVLGWSSSDLAAKLGVALSTVSRWEHGKEPIGIVPDRLLRMFIAHGKHVDTYDLETIQHRAASRSVKRMKLRAKMKDAKYEVALA